MKYLLVLLMAFILGSCSKTHVSDLLPMEEDGSLTVIRDETACRADFSLDAVFDNGYWWFNAFDIDEQILQMYWTVDGEMMYNVDYPLTGVGFRIPRGAPCTVCVTYIASNGCHRTCVEIDPETCDYQEYEEYEHTQR